MAADHLFRGKGTTSITYSVNELKKRSTQAPSVLTYPLVIAEPTLWTPWVGRYASGSPDLGYYYDAIDYLVDGVTIDGTSLRLAAGTVVAYWPQIKVNALGHYVYGLGLLVFNNGVLRVAGTPTKMTRLVACDLVQESYNPDMPLIVGDGGYAGMTMDGVDYYPNLELRFAELSFLGDYGRHHLAMGEDDWDVLWTYGDFGNLDLQDCQFRSGKLTVSQSAWTVARGPIRLNNNLFDRVATTLWQDTTLAAYNNLFRGCLLTFWGPSYPADWVFQENVFDQTAIVQGGDVVNSYNGYYPAEPKLSPPGAGNKELSTAPVYLNGTLGGFYYASSSQLYNGGLRTPAEGGVYHYTTRTDQKKESEETETPNTVNLGFHYVAVSGGVAKDTDVGGGDGLPDFCEDANRNGVYDDLTDFRNADTDGNGLSDGNEDSDSDGVLDKDEYALGTDPHNGEEDYDHDGNSNHMEKYLGTNPLVADAPIVMMGLSEGSTLPPGTVQLQVQVDPAYEILDMSLVADGGWIPGTDSPDPPLTSPLTFTVDTSRLSNGSHVLQARGWLRRLASPDPGVPLDSTVSQSITVQVFNELSFGGKVLSPWLTFPEWEPYFADDSLRVYAVCSHPGIEYKVDIRDAGGQIVHSSGWVSAADGLISYEWDVQVDNVPRNDAQFFTTISYRDEPPGGGTTEEEVTPPTDRLSLGAYPEEGAWIVAYQLNDGGDDELWHQPFDELAYLLDWEALLGSRVYAPLPDWPVYRALGKAFQICYGRMDPDGVALQGSDWDVLKASISTDWARNLWLFAHGNPSQTGADYDVEDADGNTTAKISPGSRSIVLAEEVKRMLLQGLPVHALQPYRFVFLDGCLTAVPLQSGQKLLWPDAFGISGTERTLDFYEYPYPSLERLRSLPSAFCGWTQKAGPPSNERPMEFRKEFKRLWVEEGRPLFDARDEAADLVDQRFPPSIGEVDYKKALRITGYQRLRFNEYNTRDSLLSPP